MSAAQTQPAEPHNPKFCKPQRLQEKKGLG